MRRTHLAKSSNWLFNSSATFCSRPYAWPSSSSTSSPAPVRRSTSGSIRAGRSTGAWPSEDSESSLAGTKTSFNNCRVALGQASHSPRLLRISRTCFRAFLARSESVPRPHGASGFFRENSIPSKIGWVVNSRSCTRTASVYGSRFCSAAPCIRPSSDAQSTMLLRAKKQG